MYKGVEIESLFKHKRFPEHGVLKIKDIKNDEIVFQYENGQEIIHPFRDIGQTIIPYHKEIDKNYNINYSMDWKNCLNDIKKASNIVYKERQSI